MKFHFDQYQYARDLLGVTFFESKLSQVISAIVSEQDHSSRLQAFTKTVDGWLHSAEIM